MLEGTDEFEKALTIKSSDVRKNIEKAIKSCCEIVRSTALDDMAKTPRNTDVTYWSSKNRTIAHHPSLPGNAPAPDTGNLRQSVHYTIELYDNGIIGRVGTDVEYGKHLEFGTSKMAPRPWLKPALQKNEKNIENIMKEVLKND